MPNVTFVQPDGVRAGLMVRTGQSVMEASVQFGIPGIVAECGGSCACATCHVHVDDAWLDRLEPPAIDEVDLIEFVEDRTANSRLACQLTVTDALDGLVVHMVRRSDT